MSDGHPSTVPGARPSPIEIFLIFLRLGLTSFGGPIAHIGYFRQEFVGKRKWLDEHAYGDLVSLCQFLPGPASSQIGIALGLSRGGIPGAIAAWLGFTLPAAIILVLFGLGLSYFGDGVGSGWLHGLKVVAVAVVAQAIWSMAKTLCPDKPRISIAVCAAVVATAIPSTIGQIAVILAGGIFGWAFLRPSGALPHSSIQSNTGAVTGSMFLFTFFVLLLALPIYASSSSDYVVKLFDGFFRAGALVFGGGHVVLPLLQSEVVPAGWVTDDAFLAGYGAAQAVPGPLFAFAAFLGAVSTQSPSGWLGAAIALVAIFLPAFLLIVGTLPFWERLRKYSLMRRAMLGVNASVVGLLLAAFYNPVWTKAVITSSDFCLAIVAFVLLEVWKWPPWLVVFLTALAAGLRLA